jgi:hypothetical protein
MTEGGGYYYGASRTGHVASIAYPCRGTSRDPDDPSIPTKGANTMHDRTKRLTWAALAVMLPGPWTPVIVLAYLLGRAAEREQDTAHHDAATPDHYACVPAAASGDPYARAQ